jgi:TRAP transporter TAXI family solute receptor
MTHFARFRSVSALLLILLLLAACAPAAAPAPAGDSGESAPAAPSGQRVRQSFGGGPVGGVFQVFANSMALIIANSDPNIDMAAEGTGGSAENLRSVNSGEIQYGIVYAGDIYLGRSGSLEGDANVYEDIRPVAALYGGIVQLVVTERSGIRSVEDLPGKRIAPGNAGSGAALSAERFFTHMGLWDQMTIEYLGYSQAASAMGDGQLDGFWIMAAFPNASVTEASTVSNIRLIDIYNPALEAGFFDVYPFYAPRILQADLFDALDEDVASIQDTALWTAHKDVPAELVYQALGAIFSDEGLARMREAHPSAIEMQIEDGLLGVPVPLHPGAYQFWMEQGLEIPDNLVPTD